jgi:protein-S-isoprenylcysteine O-methyltransferase Ste14
MNHDDIFRLILVGIFVLFLPFALYHRIRSNTGEKLDRWQEGTIILFGLRLGSLPWFLGSLAWMINPQWMAWSSVPLPIWLRWIGFVFIAVWVVLFACTFQTLGRNLTDTVVTRKDHSLVTTGPYRYVRHPFYLAFFLAFIGSSLVFANWFLLLAGMVPCGFLVARTRIEEEKLIEKFGDDYREYMSRTGRFWPRPGRRQITK